MKIGFTGAREGMTWEQSVKISDLISILNYKVVAHGDCVGSDAQFHKIARDYKLFVIGHPPTNSTLRAHCTFDKEYPAKPYLVRNRCIVDTTDVLLATPKEFSVQPNGGTWYTIKYALQIGKKVYIVYPDGSVSNTINNLVGSKG